MPKMEIVTETYVYDRELIERYPPSERNDPEILWRKMVEIVESQGQTVIEFYKYRDAGCFATVLGVIGEINA